MTSPDTTAADSREAHDASPDRAQWWVRLRWPVFAAGCLLTFALYWPTASSILRRWSSDPTYSHGYLVALVSVWMVWRVWRERNLELYQPSYAGLILLLGTGLVWLLGAAASIQVVQQLMLPAFLLFLGWSLFSIRGFIALLVPIGVLYFVLPAWDYIRPPLQALTTTTVGYVLNVMNIPAFIHGFRVDLPAGSFVVAEGCSGLHFFMAAGALATIQGYLFLPSLKNRAKLLAAAIAVAIVANWIRVAAVIIAGHMTDMQHFLINDHYYFGWVVFAVLMVPVMYYGFRLERSAAIQAPSNPPAPTSRRGVPVLFLSLAALVFPIGVIQTSAALSSAQPTPDLPDSVDGWTLQGNAAPDWQPVQPGADLVLNGNYRRGNETVDVWLIGYEQQTDGAELLGYDNHFARRQDGRVAVMEPGWARVERNGLPDRLIGYAYFVNGEWIREPQRAKILQMIGNLRGRTSAYGLFVSQSCSVSDCGAARDAIELVVEVQSRRLLDRPER